MHGQSSPTLSKSFVSLMSAQFLGVFNDHLFKMVVALFAVAGVVQTEESRYLSLSGALFVVPYILFSNYAGRLADRHSKRTVLIVTKFAEIVIMTIGLYVLAGAHRMEGLLVVLFLMATQSAFFSPSKFGIIPEIVPEGCLLRANGILEMARYAAVILGTVAGGVLMEVWGGLPTRIGALTVVVALVGFVCILGTGRKSACGGEWSKGTSTHGRLSEGASRILNSPALSVSVASITFFESVATLALLDILILAKIDLGVGDGLAGGLAACGAIGAGAGAYICGRLCKCRVALGLTPLAGAGLAAALLAASLLSSDYGLLAALIFVLGIFGGMYFLPFLTILQQAPDRSERGLIISTNNFMNMVGVLSASGALWLLHDVLGLAPKTILATCGIATMGFVLATAATSQTVRTSFRALMAYAFGSFEPSVFRGRVFGNRTCRKLPSPSKSDSKLGTVAAAVVVSVAALLASSASAHDISERTVFQIRHAIWGDVGTLTQEVARSGATAEISTCLIVRVSLLGVTIHSQRGDWFEKWQDGFLDRFNGTTVTNGDIERVTGRRDGDGFTIRSNNETRDAPAEIQPVNPWSKKFVEATVFMSPETGRITHSQFKEEGLMQLELGDGYVQVTAYRANADGEHWVYFDDKGMLVRFKHTDSLGAIYVTRLKEGEADPAAPLVCGSETG